MKRGSSDYDPSSAGDTCDPEMLRGFWYPALHSDRVRGNRIQAAMLLGVPLVLGRDSGGNAFALEDRCPHRAMPLSFGRFDGETLECCYHGWRFDTASGQCREIPSLANGSNVKIDRILASRFPCQEQDGYFWVFIPDPANAVVEPPPVPSLPVFSPHYRLTHLSSELGCSVDNGIIGLMDPAHGPFVHQAWWWRSRRSIHEKAKTFEPIPNGFRISEHEPSSNSAPYKLLKLYGRPVTTTIEFILPNMRLEQVRCGPYWFSSRATVTPVATNRCRIDFCAAWNILRSVPLIVPVFRVFARMFLKQDQRTMEKQAVGLDRGDGMILIDDSDRPARWYFQLKEAHLKAVQTGRPMEHPIPGPVTLRWRS